MLDSPVVVAIELFDAAGGAPLNDASATSVTVAPGATAVITTGVMEAFAADANLAVVTVNKGIVRVLTTKKSKANQQVLCTAILGDGSNNPPTVMTSLAVIRGNTQQGD